MRRPLNIRLNNNRIPCRNQKAHMTRGGSIYLQGRSIYLQGQVLRGRSIGSFLKGLWNKFRSFIVPNAKRLIKEHGPKLVSMATKKLSDMAIEKITAPSKAKTTKKSKKSKSVDADNIAAPVLSTVDKNMADLVRDQVGQGLRIDS